MMNSDERYFYLAFSCFEEGIGPYRFKLLLEHFKSAKKAWEASGKELEEVGIPKPIVEKFIDFKKKFNLEAYLKELSQKEISFITIQDESYPYLLKQISDPPFVLYVRGFLPCHSDQVPLKAGRVEESFTTEFVEKDPSTPPIKSGSLGMTNKNNIFWLSDNKLAVVGTRKPTAYGREITEILTSDLVVSGLTIVSGMARGIDTVAHRTAINNGGKTIAVLGCGVDVIYPPDNKELYYEIINGHGCIISEMPLGHWATKGTFPARNRIISGLSRGVLMTEGAEDSGALITASYAAEQGREVFAVPGPVTSEMSVGTLSLLKKGAKLVTNASDVLEELGLEQKYNRYNDYNNYKNYKDASEEENQILELLKTEDLTVDEIIRKSGFSASICSSLLSLMEIKGYIKNYEGKYSLKR